ncbi:unnamed protein product [Trypanosoma congolense IL3000]|uniref:WGS project CAEQ00000000 data, annotated contig 1615 n=1 Tax=Trypanosoma congolense (strain IL3000) TaxID=1068625 RepID=F9W7I0_TRYCI|nr:unnamed protein product [Trypanosoma congolense IL3000]
MVVLMNALMRCFAGLFGRSFFPSFLFFLKISIHTIFRVYCSSIFVRDVAFTACLSNPNSFSFVFFVLLFPRRVFLPFTQRAKGGKRGGGSWWCDPGGTPTVLYRVIFHASLRDRTRAVAPAACLCACVCVGVFVWVTKTHFPRHASRVHEPFTFIQIYICTYIFLHLRGIY